MTATGVVQKELGSTANMGGKNWLPTAAYLRSDGGAYVILTGHSPEMKQKMISLPHNGAAELVHDVPWLPDKRLLVSFTMYKGDFIYVLLEKEQSMSSSIWKYDDEWTEIRPLLSGLTSIMTCDQMDRNKIYIREYGMVEGDFVVTLLPYPEGKEVLLKGNQSALDLLITNVWIVGNAAYYVGMSKSDKGGETRAYLCSKEINTGEVHSSLLFSRPKDKIPTSYTFAEEAWLISSHEAVLLGLDNRTWFSGSSDLRRVREVDSKWERPQDAKQVAEVSGRPVFADVSGRFFTLEPNF